MNPIISADACCANYRDGENHGVLGYAGCRGGQLARSKERVSSHRLDERGSRKSGV